MDTKYIVNHWYIDNNNMKYKYLGVEISVPAMEIHAFMTELGHQVKFFSNNIRHLSPLKRHDNATMDLNHPEGFYKCIK